jgi:DNA-binding beta-propeller fold protein YncE
MHLRRHRVGGAFVLALACTASIACSDAAPDELTSTANDGAPLPQQPNIPGQDPGESVDSDRPSASSGDQSAGEPAPAPEVELESSFQAPVVSGRFIWSANPESGRVALVDALTHEVSTLPAGSSPTYLAAIAGDGQNRAIVLNTGSADATLFRQAPDGTLSQLDIPTHQNATAWATSAGGRWAIAWSDAALMGPLDPTEGLQDITVIDLAADPPRPARFSIGYRPVQVTIDADEARAYAVTRDGISVVELGDTPRMLDDVILVSTEEALAGTLGEPVLDDVPLTSDGRYALIRFRDAPKLKIIELGSGRSQVLELPGEVSDVDIAGDSQRAVAVVRSTGQVAVFDLGAALDDPAAVVLHAFSGETIGSAALPDTGSTALFFTNASDSDRLAILDTAADAAAPGAQRVVSLKAPITAVFASPEGSHAVALLEPDPASDRKGAFSVIPVADALPAKIQGTDAPPFRVTLASTAAGVRGLVTVRDDASGVHGVYVLRMPSLQVDFVPLSSPPIAAGVLADSGVAFVAQQHPEGRITFIDLETAQAETLTGFELSDRVIDGDSP